MNAAAHRITGLLADAAAGVNVEQRLEFEALPEGWTAVGGLALLAALLWTVVWMYRHEGRTGASFRARMLLAATRCVVLLALAAVWLEPVLATYLTRWVESYCLVLVDDSASMDLQDRYRDEGRAARVAGVLGAAPSGPVRRSDLARRLLTRQDGRLLRDLTARNAVRVFRFGEGLEPVVTLRARRDGGGALRSEEPDAAVDLERALSFAARGSATNAAQALRQAVQAARSGGSPLAGVIMLTDGGFTDADAFETVAAVVGEHDLPLHLVGIGDPAPPQNVRVVEVNAPESAFASDPFQITAHLSATELTGRTVDVELFERSADGGEARRVAGQQLTVTGDGALPPVTFTRARQRVGRWLYRVAVPVGEHEAVTDDNTAQAAVNVVDSRVRVLLVAGNPGWEYRYLARLLERDDAFELSTWLQSADSHAVRDGNTVIDRLPATAEELFDYDAVLLLDPDPAELPREWCALVGRLVTEYGGGLLYAAARVYTPALRHVESARPLLGLLPVTLDPGADLVLNRIGHYQLRPAPVVVPEEARSHAVLRSAAGDREPLWTRIGDVYWHYPVLRAKPVATVLLRHGDPRMANAYGGHVLGATQFAGAGRTAFLAFDGTWRWRGRGEGVFDEFWVRMMRFLVEGKLLGARKRGLILTDADRYQLGSAVTLQARVYDEAYRPLDAAELTVTCRIGDTRQRATLRAMPDRPGWFEGRFVPDRTGSHELVLALPAAGGSEPLTVRREIQVSRPNVEVLRPRMNRDGLVALAEGLEDGRYHEIDEAASIPEAIADGTSPPPCVPGRSPCGTVVPSWLWCSAC